MSFLQKYFGGKRTLRTRVTFVTFVTFVTRVKRQRGVSALTTLAPLLCGSFPYYAEAERGYEVKRESKRTFVPLAIQAPFPEIVAIRRVVHARVLARCYPRVFTVRPQYPRRSSCGRSRGRPRPPPRGWDPGAGRKRAPRARVEGRWRSSALGETTRVPLAPRDRLFGADREARGRARLPARSPRRRWTRS